MSSLGQYSKDAQVFAVALITLNAIVGLHMQLPSALYCTVGKETAEILDVQSLRSCSQVLAIKLTKSNASRVPLSVPLDATVRETYAALLDASGVLLVRIWGARRGPLPGLTSSKSLVSGMRGIEVLLWRL